MLDISLLSLSLSMLVCSIVSTHFPGLRLISVALVGLSKRPGPVETEIIPGLEHPGEYPSLARSEV